MVLCGEQREWGGSLSEGVQYAAQEIGDAEEPASVLYTSHGRSPPPRSASWDTIPPVRRPKDRQSYTDLTKI